MKTIKLNFNIYTKAKDDELYTLSLELNEGQILFFPRIGERFVYMQSKDGSLNKTINGIVEKITHIYNNYNYTLHDNYTINIMLKEE